MTLKGREGVGVFFVVASKTLTVLLTYTTVCGRIWAYKNLVATMNANVSKQLFSESGTVTLTSSSGAISGEFVALQCISDTVFSTLVDIVEATPASLGGSGSSVASTLTYPAGFVLFGRFTDVGLSSGAVRATIAVEP